jgi:hypothetical protein
MFGKQVSFILISIGQLSALLVIKISRLDRTTAMTSWLQEHSVSGGAARPGKQKS